MPISAFDLFKIGIGPSSSHTVGPMRAACCFVQSLMADNLLDRVARVKIELFGSLGATVRGHGSPKAVMLGLEGDTPEQVAADPFTALDWVGLYAIAVNEENAAGGRVVTAPINGAAGIIPAVLHYYTRFLQGDEDGVIRFLLTAAAIGILYKENASIGGAEVGCQGEVGSACSMAADALAEVLGGSTGSFRA